MVTLAAPALWPLPLLFAAFLWNAYQVHCNRDQVSTFQVLECQATILCHTVSALLLLCRQKGHTQSFPGSGGFGVFLMLLVLVTLTVLCL